MRSHGPPTRFFYVVRFAPDCNTGRGGNRLRATPGTQALDLPLALALAAGFALQPALAALAQIARQKTVAGGAVPDIGRGDRGHRPASAAARTFPGRADVLTAPEHLDDGKP